MDHTTDANISCTERRNENADATMVLCEWASSAACLQTLGNAKKRASMSGNRWFIKQIRLFEALTPTQLHRLERGACVRSFPANTTIYLPSDAAEYVYVLVEGRVRLCSYTMDGKQAISAFIEPGEMFGELAFVTARRKYDDQAEAMLPSMVASIPKTDFEAVLGECGALALRIVKLVGWRLERIERRLRTLMFRPTRDRLVFLLLDLIEKYGRKTGDNWQIGIRLSHQELANLIGSTRESVTVSLGELQDEGLVRVGRQRIVVLNLRGLADAVGETTPETIGWPEAERIVNMNPPISASDP